VRAPKLYDEHPERLVERISTTVHQVVRDAIQVVIEGHVIIDMDSRPRPLAHVEVFAGQRPECGLVERFEDAGWNAVRLHPGNPFALARNPTEPRNYSTDLWESLLIMSKKFRNPLLVMIAATICTVVGRFDNESERSDETTNRDERQTGT
jgi:hypothetical protein